MKNMNDVPCPKCKSTQTVVVLSTSKGAMIQYLQCGKCGNKY